MNRKRQSNNARRNQSFINIFGRTAIVSVGLFLTWQLFSMTVFSAVPVEARVSTPLLSSASDLLNIGSLPSVTSALSGLPTASLLQPLSAVSNVLTLSSLGSGTTLDKVINRWLNLGDFGSLGSAAIHGSFLKILQTDLSDFFGYAASGFPGTIPTPPGLPALPVPPFVRDQFVKKVAAKWGASLGSAEYKKGLAGWLALWPGASAPDRLVFAACALYPWTPAMPDAVKSFKDGYCATALPAALASKLLPPLPPPLAIAKKTLDAQVNMAQTAMLMSHALP